IIDHQISEDNTQRGNIWHIVNKYYQVDVQLFPLGDDDILPEDALTIGIKAQWPESYCHNMIPPTNANNSYLVQILREFRYYKTMAMFEQNEEEAERRRAAVAGAAVRLVVTEAAGGGVVEWAVRRRYEPVALGTPAADDDDEPRGLPRVRDALHAHTWRGLYNELEKDGAESGSESEGAGSGGSWGPWQDALSSLAQAVRSQRAAPPPADHERRRRAELLLRAALAEPPTHQ
ncbi:unnamed protein product, partial [Leptidea sinapis]